jgi:undecaprenyl-diphosphatase
MLIGMSRIFLGVHYPSDVAAGWIVGFAWASVCWVVEDHYGRRVGIEAEKQKE